MTLGVKSQICIKVREGDKHNQKGIRLIILSLVNEIHGVINTDLRATPWVSPKSTVKEMATLKETLRAR